MVEILDHLSALRVFEAVARLGSVRLAASELAVTDGAVSKQIKSLEAALNIDLFIRGHRKLILTEAAEELAATLGNAFETIVRSAERVERSARVSTLAIAAPGTFMVRWLLPRLPDLERRLKGTQINLVAWNKDISATDRSIDIHVVVGNEAAPPGMTKKPIGPETFGPVARPDLLAKGRAEKTILKIRRLGTSWPTAMWRNWSTESGNALPEANLLRFERLLFAIEAAEAGMGAALAPGPSVWDAIAAGRLQAPLGLFHRDGTWDLSWRTDQTSGQHLAIHRWFCQEFEKSQAAAGV